MAEKDKIYRRSTQSEGTPPKKKDEHARKRNRIINFRVSQKEYELINKRICLSGKDRDDFFIQSCLYQAILVRGNIRSFAAILEELRKLQIIRELEQMTDEENMTLCTIIEILRSRLKEI